MLLRLEERVGLAGIPPGAQVLDLWYPIPPDDSRQQLLDWECGLRELGNLSHDADNGNPCLQARLHFPPPELSFQVSCLVRRTPEAGAAEAVRAPVARSLFDACGSAAELFAACTGAGVPCRWVAGHPHDWVEFHVPGAGWVPADAACGPDGFGVLGADHVARSRGSDILLQPPQRGRRLPRLEGAYAEVDGRPHPVVHELVLAPEPAVRLAAGAVTAPALVGLQELAALSPPPRRLELVAGATLAEEDAGPQTLLLLRRGRLRLSRFSSAGRKLELETFEAPCAFMSSRLHRGLAEAMDDCLLRVLLPSHVAELAVERPELPLELLEMVARRLTETEDRLEYLAYHGVPARVSLALLRLRRDEDGMVEYVTHQQLADMVGAYRETVTKVLHSLQASGAIRLGHRRLQVLRPDALADLLGA